MKALAALTKAQTFTLPHADDEWIITNGALRVPGVGATLYSQEKQTESSRVLQCQAS